MRHHYDPRSAERREACIREAGTNGNAAAPTNGHAIAAEADDLARLLDDWWQKLPVLERVRCVMARASQ